MKETKIVLELKQEVAEAKLLLGRAVVECARLQKELDKEIEESRNYAAETGLLIGSLDNQVSLNKKLADGFSQALAKAETDITELKTALTTSTEMNKQLQAERSEIERIYRIFTDREPLNDFDAAWAEMEAQGYQYGEDALEQVRFGWHMAQDCLAKWRKDRV